jgi:hypothetical protein
VPFQYHAIAELVDLDVIILVISLRHLSQKATTGYLQPCILAHTKNLLEAHPCLAIFLLLLSIEDHFFTSKVK